MTDEQVAAGQWYFSRDGEEKMGPAPSDHIQQWVDSGQLSAETLVWRQGMQDWTPIQQVSEFRSLSASGTQMRATGQEQDTELLSQVGTHVKKSFQPKALVNVFGSKILWLVLLAPFVVIKMLVVPTVVSSAAATLAEGYGVDLSIEDWSANLLDLSATAENVVLETSGPYAQKELLTAEEIVVDLSLWGRLANGRWVREIRVIEPEIYVERLLSGRWNYEDLLGIPIAPSPPSAGVARASRSEQDFEEDFELPELRIENMRLEWVENLPGGSQGGMIQEIKTTLFVDDITVDAKNLIGLVNVNTGRNSALSVEARTGSGKISFSGQANLFFWALAQQQTDRLAWMPTFEGQIYLENVGTNAFARLLPDAAIAPEGGTMTGNIQLALEERRVDCHANLDIRNATFAANQASRFVTQGASSITADLSGYQANGQYQFSCGGDLEGNYRPFQAFQTNMVRHGVDNAPKSVQALAAVEHVRYSDETIDPGLESEVDRILGNVDEEWLQWAGVAAKIRDSNLGRRLGLGRRR